MTNFFIKTDAKGRPYFDFKNVRVTLVNGVEPGKDWEGQRYLQIIAYRDAGRTGTYPGPQIPITDVDASDLVILRGVHAMLTALTGDETQAIAVVA